MKPRTGPAALVYAAVTGVLAFALLVAGIAVLVTGFATALGWSLLGLAVAAVAATATLTVVGTPT